MSKFRKKPVVVEAIQWTPGDSTGWDAETRIRAFFAFMRTKPEPNWSTEGIGSQCVVLIETLEGTMRANPGDWVIRGVQGEVYSCKPDIFEATYESAEDDVLVTVPPDGQ